MRSHDVDYEVFGNDMQIVEIELDPAFHKRFGAGFFGGEGSLLVSLGDLLDGDGQARRYPDRITDLLSAR